MRSKAWSIVRRVQAPAADGTCGALITGAFSDFVERPLCPARAIHLVCVLDPRRASPQEHQAHESDPERPAEEDHILGHTTYPAPPKTEPSHFTPRHATD